MLKILSKAAELGKEFIELQDRDFDAFRLVRWNDFCRGSAHFKFLENEH